MTNTTVTPEQNLLVNDLTSGSDGWNHKNKNKKKAGLSGERLAAALQVFNNEMTQLKCDVENAKLDLPRYGFDRIARLLKKSDVSLVNGDVDLGWNIFFSALCIETEICFKLLDSNNEDMRKFSQKRIHARAISVRQEGLDKLSGWREESLKRLLPVEIEKSTADVDVLSGFSEAQKILFEHHDNVYRRLKILKTQIKYLEIIAGVALGLWVLLLIFLWIFPGLMQPILNVYNFPFTLSSLIFGTLGACISGILRLENETTKKRIPEQLESSVYAFARPLVGAVSALVVVIIVLAGILQMGAQTPGLFLALAFAGGFSERLLKAGVQKVSLGENDQNKDVAAKQ